MWSAFGGKRQAGESVLFRGADKRFHFVESRVNVKNLKSRPWTVEPDGEAERTPVTQFNERRLLSGAGGRRIIYVERQQPHLLLAEDFNDFFFSSRRRHT